MNRERKTQTNVVVSAFQAVFWCVAGFFLGLTTLAFVFGFVYKLTFATALFWNRLAPEALSVVHPSFWGTFGAVVFACLVGGGYCFVKKNVSERKKQSQKLLKNVV